MPPIPLASARACSLMLDAHRPTDRPRRRRRRRRWTRRMRGCSSIYIANEKLLFGFLRPSLTVVGTAALPHLILPFEIFIFFILFFHRRGLCEQWGGWATKPWNGCALCIVFSVSVASAFDTAQYFNAFSRIIYHMRTCVCDAGLGMSGDSEHSQLTYVHAIRHETGSSRTHTKHPASRSPSYVATSVAHHCDV